jgi:hypothetical protein
MGIVNPAQDAAQKVRDDPLLAIKRQEQKSLNDILQNPVIMNDIRKVCLSKARGRERREGRRGRGMKRGGRGREGEGDCGKESED